MQYTCTRCNGSGDDPHHEGNCIDCDGSGQRTAEGYHQETMHSSIDARDRIIALQDDMDIIKPQIQALYDDLNP